MKITTDLLRAFSASLDSDPHAAAFYRKYPRNQFWGSGNLATSSDILRDAADIADMIHRMQKTYLFSVNTDEEVKLLAVKWLISKYRDIGIDIETMPDHIEESRFSAPGISVEWGGRRLSIDFFRPLSVAFDLQKQLPASSEGLCVIELGAGLGHLARVLRLFGISRSHLIFDLPESLVFSCAFLSINFPDAKICLIETIEQAQSVDISTFDFIFVPSCYADFVDISKSELFVNTASLGEMRNETIQYWMNFIQKKSQVKYLFMQNRYLNTIDPALHPWRFEENEASLLYDKDWTIQKWDLEPTWFRCPYIVPIAARHLEILAQRTVIPVSQAQARARQHLAEVALEDWYHYADRPRYMSMIQNSFSIDVTMSGALFKLWDSVRLHPTLEAVRMLQRYLTFLLHDKSTIFEESPFYETLLAQLQATEHDGQQGQAPNLVTHDWQSKVGTISLADETRDYNLAVGEKHDKTLPPVYFAIAKTLGAINLFEERIGERELAPHLLISDSMAGIRHRAESNEAGPAVTVRKIDETASYNLVEVQPGSKAATAPYYFGIAKSLGPINLLTERVGERELPPYLLKGETAADVIRRLAAHEEKQNI